ncbi:hypothetical protein CBR_g18894 [Chara braunii]|uniref:Uncharacterized protein n=1 Tax=Chara braunii TaxID=69332 RepID=A0A388KWP9_CHABU|nr:hypothetical protein CBR_g18894 [Chara braunii]|eukprot:GBG74484.1 hypothetical protein CBR_g18894 [Chara braunii]
MASATWLVQSPVTQLALQNDAWHDDRSHSQVRMGLEMAGSTAKPLFRNEGNARLHGANATVVKAGIRTRIASDNRSALVCRRAGLSPSSSTSSSSSSSSSFSPSQSSPSSGSVLSSSSSSSSCRAGAHGGLALGMAGSRWEESRPQRVGVRTQAKGKRKQRTKTETPSRVSAPPAPPSPTTSLAGSEDPVRNEDIQTSGEEEEGGGEGGGERRGEEVDQSSSGVSVASRVSVRDGYGARDGGTVGGEGEGEGEEEPSVVGGRAQASGAGDEIEPRAVANEGAEELSVVAGEEEKGQPATMENPEEDMAKALADLSREKRSSRLSQGADGWSSTAEFWQGVVEETMLIEWPAFGKVLQTTGVVVAMILGGSVFLITINGTFAQLAEKAFNDPEVGAAVRALFNR